MRGIMGKYYWMAVDADEFELPIAVADTAKELGIICGITGDTIRALAYDGCDGSKTKRRFIRVRNDEWRK